jgi:hypothetical protein
MRWKKERDDDERRWERGSQESIYRGVQASHETHET